LKDFPSLEDAALAHEGLHIIQGTLGPGRRRLEEEEREKKK
jgi:hypothetical protein